MAISIKDLASNLGKSGLNFDTDNPIQLVLGQWVLERIKVAQAKLDEPKGSNPSRSSNASGSLRNSIAPETTTIGSKVVVDIMANSYWDYLNKGANGTQVNFGSPYSYTANMGPPVNDIATWIRDRNIQPRNPTMTRQQLAVIISESVKRKGVAPVPFMDEAFNDQAVKDLADRLTKEIKINFI
jgi:hypothetical protein